MKQNKSHLNTVMFLYVIDRAKLVYSLPFVFNSAKNVGQIQHLWAICAPCTLKGYDLFSVTNSHYWW